MIHGVGLSKRYGPRAALTDVDLHVAPGETAALLGPNGAGKSTLLRAVATLVRPDAGELTVMDHRLPEDAMTLRPHLGYLGHDPSVYLDLTPWQNLELFADLYGVEASAQRIEELLDEVGLLHRAYDAVRNFSRGMQQRLGLARLTLHRPSLLLLDEPHAGLDAPSAALLDRVVTGEATVLLVTHDVARAVATADRIIVLRAGRVVWNTTTAAIDPAMFATRYAELVA